MRSDWLLKIGIVSDIHLLIYIYIFFEGGGGLASEFSLISHKKRNCLVLAIHYFSILHQFLPFPFFFILGIDDAITVTSHALYFSDSFVYTVMLSLSAPVLTSI